MVKSFILVFIGGGLGSVARYLLGKWFVQNGTLIPLGTLLANIAACFILGFVVGLADHKQLLSPDARLFWTVGFCGGFSTFSTFSAETLSLFQTGMPMVAIVYIASSVVFCLALTLAGLYLGQHLF